jgi:hypothetical protein
MNQWTDVWILELPLMLGPHTFCGINAMAAEQVVTKMRVLSVCAVTNRRKASSFLRELKQGSDGRTSV